MSSTTNPIPPTDPAAQPAAENPAEQAAAAKPVGCLGAILGFFRSLFGKK